MKKKIFTLLLLAAMAPMSIVRAQIMNGDLNHNQGLDVEDVTLLIDGYLTGEAEWFTPKIDYYQEDNSLISGIWWFSNSVYTHFKADGTFYGREYKFFPSQGRVLLFEDGAVYDSFDVVYLTDEVMILRYSDGHHDTYTRTRPEPTLATKVTIYYATPDGEEVGIAEDLRLTVSDSVP